MKHTATPKFWEGYRQLPADIQELADAHFNLLKKNPRHPSLHLKKVGRFWSVRVGRAYRALAIVSGETSIWFWIGAHAEYDRLIR